MCIFKRRKDTKTMINCQWVIVNIHYLLLTVPLSPLSIYSSPPTPLYFSTKAAILRRTFCFLVQYCGFIGLIFGKILLRSVPFSLAYSRFRESCIYRLAASSFRFSSAISSAASAFCRSWA